MQDLVHIMIEGAVEGINCRGRHRLEYMKQIAADVGCGNCAQEISRG